MIVSIHQPNFIPWVGYFSKINQSNIFVILDNVQFEKNGFTNRNKIKNSQNTIWLTIPVNLSNYLSTKIKDIRIANIRNWKEKNLSTVKMNYAKAPFFNEIFELYENILNKDFQYLIDLNVELILTIINYLNIEINVKYASNISNNLNSTELLLDICKKSNATEYLIGAGGNKYMDKSIFEINNIKLSQYNLKGFKYPQLWGDFVPNLSILDLLFNCGKESINYI